MTCSPPQSPDPSSHQHFESGVPGVHHKRRPQDMTKMTQNTQNYSKIDPSKQKQSKIGKNVNFQQNMTISTKSGNFYMEMLLVC